MSEPRFRFRVRYYDRVLSHKGKGVQVRSFTDREAAEKFAAENQLYSRPCVVDEVGPDAATGAKIVDLAEALKRAVNKPQEEPVVSEELEVLVPVRFEITPEAISAKRAQYAALKADTPTGYEQVRLAIADCRTMRVAVEKRRVELKASALKYGRDVDAAAASLTAMLESLEEPLKALKSAVDDEKARIRREKEEAAKAALEAEIRAKREAEEAELRARREAEEAELRAQRQAEEARLAEQRAALEAAEREAEARRKAEREAEDARIAAERAKLEAERKAAEEERAREQKLRDEQAAKVAAEQKAEADRLAAERQAIEAERAKAAKEERERAEAEAARVAEERRIEAEKLAAERAEIQAERDRLAAEARAREAKEQAEREAAEAKARAEQEAAEAAERLAALRPDFEKIRTFAVAIDALAASAPKMASLEGDSIIGMAAADLRALSARLVEQVQEEVAAQ